MNDNVLKETMYYLDKYKLRAKKKFGQNFLIDPNILKNIVTKSGVDINDKVVEIGPGLGNLSKYLAINAKELDCYEIDKDMIEVLSESMEQFTNVNIFHEDILEADLSKYKNKEISVVANLPYYITTAILFKFLESDIKIKTFTLMMQKEVAQRIVGKPSTKDYNALSVILQYKTTPELLFNVSKEVFIPKPNVDSSVIKLTVKESKLNKKEEMDFIRTTKASFAMRRKTLLNNLCQEYNLEKEEIANVLSGLKLDVNVRAENLTLDNFIELSKKINHVSRET